MTSLVEARADEERLRALLADLVARQRAASKEAERLQGRAALPGAVADMGDTARRQSERAAALELEIAETRELLRHQEAVVARLEADADGA